jgi:hypothetical protein
MADPQNNVLTNQETSESRKGRFLTALQTAAEGIRTAATIFAEMKAAGDDLTFIRPGLRQTLAAIADGRMLPEVYTSFAGPLQRKLMHSPVEIQREIVEGKTMPLMVFKGDQIETLYVRPNAVEPVLLNQLFGPDGPRSEGEQRVYLETRRAKAATFTKAAETENPVVVDHDRKGIVVKDIFIPKNKLLELMMELGE